MKKCIVLFDLEVGELNRQTISNMKKYTLFEYYISLPRLDSLYNYGPHFQNIYSRIDVSTLITISIFLENNLWPMRLCILKLLYKLK